MGELQVVLVIGGTSGTGFLIARLLRSQGFTVRILARDRMRASALFGAKVDVISGDITRRETLPPAMKNVSHIIFTAGCRSGYPVGEAQIKATEYGGVLNTLSAAQRSGSVGRFLYMTSSGVTRPSLATLCLNLYKGNTLVWRCRAEDCIRASGLAYTIIRTGILLNRPGGRRAIAITQEAMPLSVRHRIARLDVAEAFVAALQLRAAERATFEVSWARGDHRKSWPSLLASLKPDPEELPAGNSLTKE